MNENYTHGGDWVGYQKEYGREPLDFSINVSPLGTPEGVIEALREAACEVDRYPDPFCRELRERIAESEGVSCGQILCGNGAADLIGRIVQALRPGKGLVTAPCFLEYKKAMEIFDVPCVQIRLRPEEDFRLPADFAERIPPDTDLVFLCQPNNPTGVTAPVSLLKQVLDRCRRTGAVLVMDECFTDLLDEPERFTMKPYLEEYPNLIVLKAFTKTYAIPGVRLGYCLCSDTGLLERIAACGQAWEVSHPAQRAGIAALQDRDYPVRTRSLLGRERPALKRGLEKSGMKVIPGEANFLLFSGPPGLSARLKEHGILIRSCTDYQGLPEGQHWYRAAVRTEKENRQLLSCLEQLQSGGQ